MVVVRGALHALVSWVILVDEPFVGNGLWSARLTWKRLKKYLRQVSFLMTGPALLSLPSQFLC